MGMIPFTATIGIIIDELRQIKIKNDQWI